MKLLTCNSHSIIEKDYDNKLKYFAQWILDMPDIGNIRICPI